MCIATTNAGARSPVRAIPGCTVASRCLPLPARWRSATPTPTSTTPAASPATRSSICGSWAITSGGWRTPTCGRSNGCCSTTRTARLRRLIGATSGCARATARSGRPILVTSRCDMRAAIGGRRSRPSSIQVEISGGFRYGLAVRPLERFFEPARERVAARLLRLHRLLENRFPARRLLRQDALRFGQLRLVATLGLVMADDTTEIDVDHEKRLAAGTAHFDFRLQPRHYFFPPSAPARPLTRNVLSSTT